MLWKMFYRKREMARQHVHVQWLLDTGIHPGFVYLENNKKKVISKQKYGCSDYNF